MDNSRPTFKRFKFNPENFSKPASQAGIVRTGDKPVSHTHIFECARKWGTSMTVVSCVRFQKSRFDVIYRVSISDTDGTIINISTENPSEFFLMAWAVGKPELGYAVRGA